MCWLKSEKWIKNKSPWPKKIRKCLSFHSRAKSICFDFLSLKFRRTQTCKERMTFSCWFLSLFKFKSYDKHRFSDNLSPCSYSPVNKTRPYWCYFDTATSRHSRFARMAAVTEKYSSNKYESRIQARVGHAHAHTHATRTPTAERHWTHSSSHQTPAHAHNLERVSSFVFFSRVVLMLLLLLVGHY